MRTLPWKRTRGLRLAGHHGATCLAILVLANGIPTARTANAQLELPRAEPEYAGFSAERLHRINETIQKHIDERHISGAVTLVARRGFVVHFEAHGLKDVAAKQPMSRDTLFRMASSTKPVTGVAVMMLIEEGKIRLQDPVAKFLPEFKGLKVAEPKEGSSEVTLVAPQREVTIRDLLTHTSGLVSGGIGTQKAPKELLRPTDPEETLARYIPRLASVPLDFQPGSSWKYSGLAGLDTLARVVEVASGQAFDEFLRKQIFEPLGMADTTFVVPDEKQARLAKVYRSTDKGLEETPPMIRFPKSYTSGAGGLSSTASDYFRFAQMLVNGGQLGGKHLLSPRAVELMSSNHVGDMFPGQLGRPKGMGFGLTVEVVEENVQAGTFRSNGSFGWDGAFGTHFWVDPQEQLVAVLMIQTNVGRMIHRDFETAVMQAIVQ
jgi:CubicO group peptidase (beta-lactamase class C family)